MNWIFFSLIAPLFWTGSNFIDKFVLDRHSKGVADYLFFSTITNLPICAALITLFGWPHLTHDAWIPLMVGIFVVLSYGFYARALQVGDTTRIVLLYKLIPVLTLTLAFLLLGQKLSPRELVGFFVILAGALAVSQDGKRGRFMAGFGWILIAMLMWAGLTLLTDYGLTTMDYWHFAIIESFGSAVAGAMLFIVPSVRRSVVAGLQGASRRKYGWFTINNLIDFAGHLSINKAFALAPSAGLVTVVMQVQSAYAIAMGALLTILLPGVVKEDISVRGLLKKSIAALIMFGGIYILVMRE